MRYVAAVLLLVLSAGWIYATTANPVSPNCIPPCCKGPVRGDVDYLCSRGTFSCSSRCIREQDCYLETGPPQHSNYLCRWDYAVLLTGCRFDNGHAIQNKCDIVTTVCDCTQSNACEDAVCHMNPQECFFSLRCIADGWR